MWRVVMKAGERFEGLDTLELRGSGTVLVAGVKVKKTIERKKRAVWPCFTAETVEEEVVEDFNTLLVPTADVKFVERYGEEWQKEQ